MIPPLVADAELEAEAAEDDATSVLNKRVGVKACHEIRVRFHLSRYIKQQSTYLSVDSRCAVLRLGVASSS